MDCSGKGLPVSDGVGLGHFFIDFHGFVGWSPCVGPLLILGRAQVVIGELCPGPPFR